MRHHFSLQAFRCLAVASIVLLEGNSALTAAPTKIGFDQSGNTASQQSATPAAPTITGQPVALNAAGAGEPASFSVSIASTLPVTYQWYFNSTLIPGATHDTLLVNDPTFANEGLYTVTITNSLGNVTSDPARLTIDTNGNGLGDNWEQQYFGNLDQKAAGDFDGDQLTNIEEFLNGTNPAIRDAYYWTATSGDFDNAANWNWKRVPGLGDTAFINSGTFNINTAGAAPKVNLTVNQAYIFSPTANTTLTLAGTWTLNGPVTLTSGRTLRVTSGSLTINGPTTLNGANLIAEGSNTKFVVNGITKYTQPNNTQVEWRAGESGRTNLGCELSFPNLTSITGGNITGFSSDYFVLYGRTGGTLNLPALTRITVPLKTGAGYGGVQLYAIDSGILDAPLLSGFNDANGDNRSVLVTHTGGSLRIPQLTAPFGVRLDMSAESFNLSQFVSLERTNYIRLLGGQASINVSNIDYVKEIYAINDGTKLTFPNVTSYTQPNNAEVQWRAGESGRTNLGCELNFPNLTSITGGNITGFSSDYFVLYGRTGGTLNLPALTSIAVPVKTGAGYGGVQLYAIDNGTVNAPLLSGFNDANGDNRSVLVTHTGGSLRIPQLTAPYGVRLDMSAENFNLGQFVSLERTNYIRLLGGQASINVPNIDHVKEIYAINDGTKLTFPNVTSYTQPNNTEVEWRAGEANRTNTGCELNFPNLTTIFGGVATTSSSRYFDLIGRTGATLNLPFLTSITMAARTGSGGSGVRFFAIDSGQVYAPRLATFSDLSASPLSRIEISANSRFAFTSLRAAGVVGVNLVGLSLLTGAVVFQPPVITSAGSVTAVFENPFSFQIGATNNPHSYGANPLPPGLVMNPISGLISGIPSLNGVYNLTVTARNGDGQGSQTLEVRVVNPTATPRPANLISWWSGNEDGRDLVGGQHGILKGAVGFGAGKVRNAFIFGEAGQSVVLPQAASIDLSRLSAWTIEAWVRPTSFTNSSFPTIYSQGRFRVSLGLRNGTGQLESWINDSNRLNTTTRIPLNAWTHVAMSYDGTKRTFHINGKDEGSGAAPAITDEDAISAIGDVAGNVTGRQFLGQIDEVALYSRVLTTAEISTIHLAGLAGKQLPAALREQSITFGPPADQVFKGGGSNTMVLAATASSGLPVSFSVVSGPAEVGVDGRTLTLLDAGPVTVRAVQRGNSTFLPAASVERSFVVTRAPPSMVQTIAFGAQAKRTYGDYPVRLMATASSGLPVSFELVSGPAVLNGALGELDFRGAGNVVVRAIQPGDNTYLPAAAVTRTIVVEKAELFVSGVPASRSVGVANPPLSLSYDGFVGDDSEGDLDRKPVGTSRATKTSAPGDYPITFSGGSDDNYVFVPGWVEYLTVVSFGGSYEGLVVDGGGIPVGKIAISVRTNSLGYSGRVDLGVEASPVLIKGTLNPALGLASAALSFSRAAKGTVPALDLSLVVSGTGLTGTVSREGVTVGSVEGGTQLMLPEYPLGVGAHSLVLGPPTVLSAGDTTAIPGGAGYATAAIRWSGNLDISGRLSDGVSLTASLRPAADRSYRLWVRPYGSRLNSFVGGRLAPEMHPDTTRFAERYYIGNESARLIWKKQGLPAGTAIARQDRSYRGGFGPVSMRVMMDPWLSPTTTEPLVKRVRLAASGVSSPVMIGYSPVALDLGVSASGLPRAGMFSGVAKPTAATLIALPPPVPPSLSNPTKWRLRTLSLGSGLFSGEFVLSDPIVTVPVKMHHRVVSFRGIFRQPASDDAGEVIGAGYFLVPSLPPTTQEQPSGELRFSKP